MASRNQSAPQDSVTGGAGAPTSKPEISTGHPITQALTEDTGMNSRQRYKAKRAAEHRERTQYCQKIERAFSRLSEDCSNRVLRATSLGSLRDKPVQEVEQKQNRDWCSKPGEMGVTCTGRQKQRGKSIPAYYD